MNRVMNARYDTIHEDRRSHLREACFLPVTCRPRGDAEGPWWPATLVDISRGGAFLGLGSVVPAAHGGWEVLLGDEAEPIRAEYRHGTPSMTPVGLISGIGVEWDDEQTGETAFRWARGGRRSAPRRLRDIRLGNGEGPAAFAKRLLREFGWSRPLSNLAQRLAHAGLQTVVVEADRVETDPVLPAESFSSALRPRHEALTRIHFFSATAGSALPSDEGATTEYSGFVTVRPTGLREPGSGRLVGHVVEAAIGLPDRGWAAPPLHASRAPARDDSEDGEPPGSDPVSMPVQAPPRVVALLNCVRAVPVLGRRQPLLHFPFVSQDLTRTRCAHAAVLMVAGFLHRYLAAAPVDVADLQALLPPQDGLWPPDGLPARDLVGALRLTGMSVAAFRVDLSSPEDGSPRPPPVGLEDFRALRRSDLLDTLHVFLDSHLPPILLVRRNPRRLTPDHVLTVVGHATVVPGPGADGFGRKTMSVRSWGSAERSEAEYQTTTCLLTDLIVHDDTIAPYLLLGLTRGDSQAGSDRKEMDRLWDQSFEDDVVGFVAPLFRDVHFDPVRAQEHAAETALSIGLGMDEFLRTWRIEGSASMRHFADVCQAGKLLVVTYLDSGSRFRTNMIRRMDEQRAEKVDRDFFDNLRLPRHVWVTELMDLDEGVEEGLPRAALGHIVTDATASAYSTAVDLVYRIGEAVVDMVSQPGFECLHRLSTPVVPSLAHLNFSP